MRSIFWKIFLSFWLANLVILVVTTIVIIASMESKHLKERHSQFILDLSNHIISLHENSRNIRKEKHVRSFISRSHKRKHLFHQSAITILDSNKNVIFQHGKFHKIQKKHISTLKTQSNTGRNYTIRSGFGPPPKFILDTLRKKIGVQFFLILLVSVLTSFILSLTLVIPLKKLGKFSRYWSQDQDKHTISSRLLTRRDEIGDLARDMTTMNEKVVSSINSQKQLLHDVSHELRAPLARLQAVAGLIEQQTSGHVSGTERMHKECEKIDKLLQKILDYSRLDETTLQLESISIEEYFHNILQNIKIEFPHNKLILENNSDISKINIQSDIFESSLTNILRNSCKYSPENEPISVTINSFKTGIEILIRDHGPGINKSDIKNIFTPFYRAGNAMHGDGHGLGLSIAKRAIEKHGGNLTLTNHPKGGLEAYIHLPNA